MQNSGLRRINTGGFDKGLEQAQKSARANLDFVLKNQKYLLKARNGKKHLQAAVDMNNQKHDLTPNQMSYCEGLYERTMSGAGFENCNLHVDRKPKGLRY